MIRLETDETRDHTRESLTRVVDRLVIALAALIALGTMLAAFCVRRLYGTEEAGLLNVPYMIAEYGKLAFPLYGYWFNAAYDKLFVHMPTHYFVVGVLMRLGISLYYAEACATVFFILLSLWLICTLRAEPSVKLGLTMGFGAAVAMFASIFPVDYFFHLRPDAHMAMAWFAGLLTLEHARLGRWKNAPLFWGAALMTYASTVHFSGAIAFTSVAVYLVLAWRDLSFPAWTRKTAVVALGGTSVAAPFLFFYLIPNWFEIRNFTEATQALGDWRWTIATNFSLYPRFYESAMMYRVGTWDLISASPVLLALRWSLPPFVAATVLLALRRSTRALAVSGLVVPSFLFFYSRRKLVQYLLPEATLVLVGFWVLVASACWYIATRDRTGRWGQFTMPAAVGLFAIQLIVGTPALRNVRLTLTPRLHEMVIERALGRTIVGADAMVASQLGLWYVTGATRWFDTTKDLLWTIPEEAPPTFWRRFDAVACHLESWQPTNTGWNEATLYRDGFLSLRGFYVAPSPAAIRGWTLFSVDRPSAVQGYFWQNGTQQHYGNLQHFVQSPHGSYELVTGVTNGPTDTTRPRLETIADVVRQARPLLVSFLALPRRANVVDEQEYIFVMLAPSTSYAPVRDTLRSRTRLLDEVSGTVEEVDVAGVVRDMHDERITFLRTHEEAFARYAHPASTSQGDEQPISVSLKYYPGGADHTVTQESGRTVVTASRAGQDWMATTDLLAVRPQSHYLVSFDLRIDRGGTGFHVMRGADPKPLASFYREAPQGFTRESFVVYTGAGSQVRFVVTAFNAYRPRPVSFAIENLQAVRVALSR
jgi:hypothetical protein